MDWSYIESAISAAENIDFQVKHARSIGGGSINSAYLLENDAHRYFVKLNSTRYADMFSAEAEGLAEMHMPGVIKVPRPVCWDSHGSTTYIVLDYIEFGRANANSAAMFGEQLAAMHKVSQSQFGWYRDNTIGSTAQINTVSSNWLDFYRQHRLQFQIKLANEQGYNGELTSLGDKLCDSLESFFKSYQPQPSLLHGDLWSGNYDYDASGKPVIFDPAVYYGDREADIAMTELFGGFSAAFYDAYNNAWPLDDGYAVRKTLYNLYHILNHLNLFGGGYYSQAISMMRRLLSEI
ncbi:MAG: fructosamine kinase family protein [Gammaproteobacteria bacterium]|nr:fructosamine kinase family protein [Gammaproteobacteria bacterium]